MTSVGKGGGRVSLQKVSHQHIFFLSRALFVREMSLSLYMNDLGFMFGPGKPTKDKPRGTFYSNACHRTSTKTVTSNG